MAVGSNSEITDMLDVTKNPAYNTSPKKGAGPLVAVVTDV